MDRVISVDVEGDFGTDRLRGVDEVLPTLLDGFEARGIKAVLFVVGQVARARPAAVRAAAARGHAIGSHTMNHTILGRVDAAKQKAELLDSRRAIEDITGQPCRGFRAPFFDAPAHLGELLEESGSEEVSPQGPLFRYGADLDGFAGRSMDGERSHRVV